MAAPTAAADTSAPPPPPPSVEPAAAAPAPDQKVSPPAAPQPDAPAPPPAPAPAPVPKKRKLEEAGFHITDYYKIRAVIADLRVRFVQVCNATDSRNTDVAREILKEIKVVMDLSKTMRLKLGVTSEPVKPSEKPSAGFVKDELVKPSEKPSAGPVTDEHVKASAGPVKDEPMKPLEKPSAEPVKDEPTKPDPAGENNQTPGVGQTTISSTNVDAPVKHDNSEAQQ
ncbi:hypothetical protein BS78_04G222600 [Paspalum vaginatum]|nr:hypothetical protein BS78_04G222600 [Paspalum vaginatum]